MTSQVSFPHKRFAVALTAAVLLPLGALAAPTDPGVRGGGAAAGGVVPGLTANEATVFATATDAFAEVDDVAAGLGPRFNMDSCAGCHAFPAAGGSSPPTNPQIAVATKNGARNVVPSFLSANGPVRESRFVKNADGSNDGGVHQIFVTTGRADAPAGCNIAQPNFAQQLANNNVIFRIPTPTFGLGLVELIMDEDIVHNKVLSSSTTLGISGHENRSGNDGTITRFGWKAQNKSLNIFSGEAYNAEQGVTNTLFPNEKDVGENNRPCISNSYPESPVNFTELGNADLLGDVALFSIFMQFLAAPTPVPVNSNNHIVQGFNQFVNIGCANCHTRAGTFKTMKASVAALSEQPVDLWSDLLVHNMGPGLADRVSQGNAGGDEFRTAPLWGVGQRIFFLHDGRTSNIVTAVQAHKSFANSQFPASEANKTVDNFNALSASDQQDVITFLRSL